MYRAQSDVDYALENVNTADLAGLLWYLHNEVVTMCPRKYNITRVLRLKVTLFRPIIPYVAFDMGRCTVPECEDIWETQGYPVGCQGVVYGVVPPAWNGGIRGQWYSLPGRCPSMVNGNKSPECIAAAPGGACRKAEPNGDCSYHVEHAGEVRLDELTGIDNYDAFCKAGNMEYDSVTDRGRHFSFWDGKTNITKCRWRYEILLEAFHNKYPDLPATINTLTC